MEIQLDELFRRLDAIEKADLRITTVVQIQKILNELLDGFPTDSFKLPPNQYIHRTRIWRKPDNISQITYPPSKYAALGRANDLGTSRFYGSIGRNVPFFETNPTKGDLIILSTWKTSEEMLLNTVGFTESTTVMLNSKRQLEKLYCPQGRLDDLTESQKVIREFLARWFATTVDLNETHLYKTTAAISNILLAGDVFDGLIYPTVKMYGNADNVVLTPQFVDRCLKLVSVEYMEVKENDGIKYKIEVLATSVKWDQKGNIEWSGKELGWNYPIQSKITMKGANGEWINLDEADRRIDPVPTNPIWKPSSPVGIKFKNCYPDSFKAGADFQLKGPEGEFTIKFAVVYDFARKEKFLVFYIPKCNYPFDAARALGNGYNHFIEMTDKEIKEIRISNADSSDPVSSELFNDGKCIHFFMEDILDAIKLGMQITAGYQLKMDSPPLSAINLNYIYKPS